MTSLAQTIAQADPDIWWFIGICGVMSMVGFFTLKNGLHRHRLIENMPRSLLRSAAQGYVELHGSAHRLQGEPMVARLSARPCVWFQFEIAERRRGKNGTSWVKVESGASTDCFQFRDDTGECVVDPEGADVIAVIKDQWYGDERWPVSGPPQRQRWWHSGRYRYTEQRIHDGDELFVLGRFRSQSTQASASASVADLLRLWKQDSAALHERFDANRDGAIDNAEWDAARRSAEQQVLQERVATGVSPPVHRLCKPDESDRPYVISAKPEALLIKHYRRNFLVGIILFLGCGAAFVWMLSSRLAG